MHTHNGLLSSSIDRRRALFHGWWLLMHASQSKTCCCLLQWCTTILGSYSTTVRNRPLCWYVRSTANRIYRVYTSFALKLYIRKIWFHYFTVRSAVFHRIRFVIFRVFSFLKIKFNLNSTNLSQFQINCNFEDIR